MYTRDMYTYRGHITCVSCFNWPGRNNGGGEGFVPIMDNCSTPPPLPLWVTEGLLRFEFLYSGYPCGYYTAKEAEIFLIYYIITYTLYKYRGILQNKYDKGVIQGPTRTGAK